MSECNHDCASCSQQCEQRDLKIQANQASHIKKIIGVVSSKGGVGKSLVTSLLASATRKAGYNTAILDADITGPSIPQAFNLNGFLTGDGKTIVPAETKSGIKVVSTNLILADKGEPVLWRGPIIASLVKQFYSDVLWGDIDYMFVDMPPGTGDVALTVFQSLPIDGIIVVSTPQQLVSMIVEKALRMANTMNVKIYGLVENMSYISCDNCGHKVPLFGKDDNIELLAKRFNLDILAQLPLDVNLTSIIDKGQIEDYDCEEINRLVEKLKDF
ncbi:MAG: P-loop NTPase [Erysipelotrichaceae bacterium]